MKDFGVVEALYQWSRLKQDFSGKPFFVLPFRKFWEHVSAHYGSLWGYSAVLIPIRVSLLILADTSCNERGIAEYNRIHTTSRPNLDVSKVRYLFTIKHYGQNPCMNLMPRTSMRGGCALSLRETVFRRVPNDDTWRHSSERS
jgi:hypothetical protein